MSIDVIQISTLTITTLIPILRDFANGIGKNLAESIGKKAGEKVIDNASEILNKLLAKPETKAIIDNLARNPDDTKRQEIAIEDLASYLSLNMKFARDLSQLMGEKRSKQEIIANKQGHIEDVTQEIEGAGKQFISATSKGVVKGVRQIKRG